MSTMASFSVHRSNFQHPPKSLNDLHQEPPVFGRLTAILPVHPSSSPPHPQYLPSSSFPPGTVLWAQEPVAKTAQSLPSGSLTHAVVTGSKQAPAQLNAQGQTHKCHQGNTQVRAEGNWPREMQEQGTYNKVGSPEDGADTLVRRSESSSKDISQATGRRPIY